ncbi:probable UDP-N-acetylglucosamine--peptide N-acetylglucosaminyltransferase SEC, partial [Tanacetum coccineum]
MIGRIQKRGLNRLDTAYPSVRYGVLGISWSRTTLDIFQNIQILYLEYGVLGLFLCGLCVGIKTLFDDLRVTTDKGFRNETFALQPAPIQVSYMGCLGTTGASYIQYLVTDEFVSPTRFAHIYSKKLVQLPHYYFVNDYKQEFFDVTRVLVMLGSKLLMQAIFSIFDNLVRMKAQEQDDLLLWLK